VSSGTDGESVCIASSGCAVDAPEEFSFGAVVLLERGGSGSNFPQPERRQSFETTSVFELSPVSPTPIDTTRNLI
jgi:hypothetical protein